MSRLMAGRRVATQTLALRPFGISPSRHFSHTTPSCDESNRRGPPQRAATQTLLDSLHPGKSQGSSHMQDLARTLGSGQSDAPSTYDTSALTQAGSYVDGQPTARYEGREDDLEPYHMHVLSHRHNTHITVTKPNRDPIISLSCGNLGYKKARRGLYDAAYSTTKYLFERLVHNGWQPKINKLELVLRGFGQGREAAVKVIMSPEGKPFRDKIVRVADSTRIKFAGTRSPKPKRR